METGLRQHYVFWLGASGDFHFLVCGRMGADGDRRGLLRSRPSWTAASGHVVNGYYTL